MCEIIETTIDYDFSKIYFGPPTTIVGGSYFTRLMYGTNKNLFIQTPKCLTKQGFVKSGKKMYVDLMFDNNDTVFIQWIENLEQRCQELIYVKRDTWFETKLEKTDIESAFISPFKIYKSGKYYVLRANVKPTVKVYDENDQIVSVETVSNTKTMISILEIQGLKFSSRDFQIEIELKQSMLVSPDPFLDMCFIKKPIQHKQSQHQISQQLTQQQPIDTNEPVIMNADMDIDMDMDIDKLIEDSAKSLQTEPILDNNEIVLEIEEIDIAPEPEPEPEDPNILKEIDVTGNLDEMEPITLKKPNQVYYDIYLKAKEKAKEAKKQAVSAYLEMKNIKKTYMLDTIDDSDSDVDEDYVFK